MQVHDVRTNTKVYFDPALIASVVVGERPYVEGTNLRGDQAIAKIYLVQAVGRHTAPIAIAMEEYERILPELQRLPCWD